MNIENEPLRIRVEVSELEEGQILLLDVSGHLLITISKKAFGELQVERIINGWGNVVFIKENDRK